MIAPLGKATDLVEVISDDLPNAWPLQTDAVHVVVGDLHYLLQTEHAWLMSRGQLVHGHRTEPTHKVHWRWSSLQLTQISETFCPKYIIYTSTVYWQNTFVLNRTEYLCEIKSTWVGRVSQSREPFCVAVA